ncbi:lipase maturation factor 1 isoform X2 [Pteropus alecto]|uniref:lipase maturation factor 1 isoform X2 n=1 Tax=Pteropus alecto TaxID=9402 RepID=UPI0007685A6E|nr:lipase maturation factor 1 isoform X2 [Pteropus alecto]
MAVPVEQLRRRKARDWSPGHGSPPRPERDPAGCPAHLRAGTFWLTRIVLLRALAFVYFVAFLVAFHQNKQLIGDRGLLPCKAYLKSVQKHFQGRVSWDAVSYAPTILWLLDWSHMDSNLDALALLGLGISFFILVTGCANMVLMAVLWILYMSLVNVGQIWMGVPASGNRVPGDFLVPSLDSVSTAQEDTPSPDRSVGLSVADFQNHARSRPDQDPGGPMLAGPHLHGLPLRDTAGAQPRGLLPAPLPMVGPSLRDTQQPLPGAGGTLLHLPRTADVHPPWRPADPVPGPGCMVRQTVNLALGVLVAWLSIPVVLNLLSPKQVMNTSFSPLRIVNTYGAFGSITRERTEVILQGTASPNASAPDAVWEDYEFKCKPGDLRRRPCLISPYHYRLDWLMWFAAFQTYEQHEWVIHLAGKLLANDAKALSLLALNPFADRAPPRWVRGEHYRYKFSRPGGPHAADGKWWIRKRIGPYFPPLSLRDLKGYFRSREWPYPELE